MIPEVTGDECILAHQVTHIVGRRLLCGYERPDRLRDAAALGTATALAPVAGEFDPADYTRFRSTVMVAELSRPNGGGG